MGGAAFGGGVFGVVHAVEDGADLGEDPTTSRPSEDESRSAYPSATGGRPKP